MTTYQIAAVQTAAVSGTAVDGTDINMEAVDVQLLIEASEVTALLASYTPSDPASPAEAVSREMARAVLDALIAAGVT
jgi:hypothetical protein